MSDATPSKKHAQAQGQSPLNGGPAQVELLDENRIALVKNGKRHVFSCMPGEEADLLNQIALMVSDPASELTWFDAAVLSHQLGERMSQRIQDMAQLRRSA
ncbi:MAG: hypothetical protein AAGC44_05880 [Planctomycetota bacterium]